MPYSASASVSIMAQVGARVGADVITFDAARANSVFVNGVAAALTVGATQQLSGGTLRMTSPNIYLVTWNSGETMIARVSSEVDIQVGLGPATLPNAVQGLFGTDNGRRSDFSTPDGTVLTASPTQPLTGAQLYGQYANGWRVTQATSLLDYLPGQTTSTFTDTQFPFDAVALANLPASVVAAAATKTSAAGIVDPTIAQQAQLDFAATGDPSFLASAQFAQASGITPTLASSRRRRPR